MKNPKAKKAFSFKSIIIAGGGTGGHLFPGIAIANAFKKKDSKNRITFIGTGRSLERSVIKRSQYDHRWINIEGIKGRNLLQQIVSMLKIPKSLLESIGILRELKPDIVIGMGGYSAGPVVIGAWLMGIKTVICEQNVQPGVTNRILTRFAKRVYVSFEKTKSAVNPKKLLFTGNPVRQEILEYVKSHVINKGKKNTINQPFTVLILGGSQGARSINTAMIGALEHIKKDSDIYFIHQTGNYDERKVKEAYEKKGIRAKVCSFFTDMTKPYKEANLIICRAGATTVAEITAMGKAAIFVPYPFAADNHQVLNVKMLRDKKAAEMILDRELTGEKLADKINYYALNQKALDNMASRAKKMGRPNAAQAIVEDCYKLTQKS